MAWYDEAIFYHIYPLGLCGAPKENSYGEVEHRLTKLTPWIDHVKEIGCNAIYIGPLFESVGHGYETTDYKKLDSRLGDNEDLKKFVKDCHDKNIRVIFDGVFNHTGRDFFAFKDIKEKRESSAYRDWYCNVNFGGNNEYNDGFSYDNWGGYNLLVKLNQRNPAVRDYILDVIRFWVKEFDVDGIRLDAADVLDFDFMKSLRQLANTIKPEFWLMGEVIHGDYGRWVNEGTLHSVTNYMLHKGLYSGHNDHNYYEIAHTIKYVSGMIGNNSNFKLYNFVDNHDVERITTKLNNKAHFTPVHILLYTLPGIPSIYYGSEFAIEGKKEQFSDDSLRPALNLDDYADAVTNNPATKLIKALGEARASTPALSYGDFNEVLLTNRQFAFTRRCGDGFAVVCVNNDDNDYDCSLPAEGGNTFTGLLSGETVSVNGGRINVKVKANSGDIWVPSQSAATTAGAGITPVNASVPVPAAEKLSENAADISGFTEVDTPIKAQTVFDSWMEVGGSGNAPQPDSKDNAETPTSESFTEVPVEPAKTESFTEVPVEAAKEASPQPDSNKSYEDGVIAGLQQAVLARMEKNGPVTDQMRKDVMDNVYHDSLINWIKSF